MLCLEARPIAYRAGESDRQERNGSGLRLQAHPPLPGGQPCSAFCTVDIWWFWSIESVLPSFGNIMSVSFCGTVSGCIPRPCAHRIQSTLGTESGYVVRPCLSGWYIAVAIVIGSIWTSNPLKKSKAMRPLLGLLGRRQIPFLFGLEFEMRCKYQRPIELLLPSCLHRGQPLW